MKMFFELSALGNTRVLVLCLRTVFGKISLDVIKNLIFYFMYKFNFRERMLRAYAAIMKFLAPTYCVKSLTLNYTHSEKRGSRKNENATLFLPGVEKELKAIEKLQLGEAALKAREWSYDTRIALLKSGNFALISRINTEKELNFIVDGVSTPTEAVIEAFKVYTPSKKYLLEFLSHPDRNKLFAVIAGAPATFDALTVWEVLNVAENQPYEGKDRWTVVQALVNAKPSWAPKFVEAI